MLRAAVLGVLLALALAGPAAANSSFSFNAGTVTVTAAPGAGDQLTITKILPSGATQFTLAGTTFSQVNADPSNCGPGAPTTTVTCTAAVSRIVVSLGDGADRVDVTEGANVGAELDITLGPGSDIALLLGSTGPTVTRGGDGDDRLEGGLAADRIEAGDGDDTLALSKSGADDLSGGPGTDALLTAPDRPAIAATLDDVADDVGGGNVRSDIEDIQGSDGADSVVGSAQGNILDGGGGGDVLDGRGGYDRYAAGAGNDTLNARDGLAELVGCGEGVDVAQVDDVDIVAECETVNASAELRPDADGDGARKPGDCDDGNPAIRPGAVDVLDNLIDEDCDGADAVDLDRDDDGFARPFDCDDNRADVRPGGSEVPGNAADEDCNGTAAPFPRLLASVVLSTATDGGVTRVVSFRVLDLAGGERIDVSCEGRGCPFAFRTRTAGKRKSLTLLAPFAKARLRVGAVVTVRVTRADGVAKEHVARVGKRRVRHSTGCITPPRRTAVRC